MTPQAPALRINVPKQTTSMQGPVRPGCEGAILSSAGVQGSLGGAEVMTHTRLRPGHSRLLSDIAAWQKQIRLGS